MAKEYNLFLECHTNLVKNAEITSDNKYTVSGS